MFLLFFGYDIFDSVFRFTRFDLSNGSFYYLKNKDYVNERNAVKRKAILRNHAPVRKKLKKA